ncbi:MAG: head GIN domain-containing protein [bacterium]
MKSPCLLWFFIPGILLALLNSCAKEGGKCLSSTGPIIMQERNIPDFDSISVNDYVNLILTQDTVNRVFVEAGQNIIGGISTNVEGTLLIIHNYNECNWTRNYSKPINVYVSVKNLMKLSYNSSGDVTTSNALMSSNLWVDVWGGCGTIDLELNLYQGTFIEHMGTADFKLRGICKISSIYAGDFGLFDCRDMETGYTYIKNYGSNDCYINVSKYLDATVGSIGSIYYRGGPDTVYTAIYGNGVIEPF